MELPVTYSPGDPGHIQAHVDLVTAVNTEAERFGLADDLPLRGVGDEGHLDDHNAIRAKLELIETTAGRTFGTPLPPVRNLGDPGHVDDHTALLACALEASLWPAWNDATGGTITTVDNYNGTGEKWRVHTFTSNGTLDVSLAVQPFRVLVVGGGGGCGSRGSGHPGGGGGGGVVAVNLNATAGAHSVTVGAGGYGPGGGDGIAASAGGASTFLTATAGGGGASSPVYGSDSTPGAPSGSPQSNPGAPRTADGGSGEGGGAGGTPQTATGYSSDITGSAYSYGDGGRNGAAVDSYGEGGARSSGAGGYPGVVIVSYRIG